MRAPGPLATSAIPIVERRLAEPPTSARPAMGLLFRVLVAAVIAVALLFIGPTPAANAATSRSSVACTSATTDVPVRVCARVYYWDHGARGIDVYGVRVWWSPAQGASASNGNAVLATGVWRGVGALKNNEYRSIAAPLSSSRACGVRGVLDGPLWLNASWAAYPSCV